jgi:signal transduction histidine kinase
VLGDARDNVGTHRSRSRPLKPETSSMSQDSCPLAGPLAAKLRAARAELTGRWLERIVQRVAVDRTQVFPTDDLLDHIPLLVVGIADYLEDPGDVIAADSAVVFHARELGSLRHGQGFSEYEVLKEFEILGSILFAFLSRVADELDVSGTRSDLLGCSQRLFQAIALVQQTTTARFLELARSRIREREERLRAFHRALTHEMRTHIGATLGAGQILQIDGISGEQRAQLAGVVVRNSDAMRLVLENLLELARLEPDTRQERRVSIRAAASETARQLRGMATAAKVDVQLSAEMPDVEVNAAAVELCLGNLLANAIKYADPRKSHRWVRVSARPGDDPSSEVVVEVRDNGLGVPPASRPRLFQRFFRAHEAAAPAIPGTGLGLSLVREVVHSLGGRVWAEHPDEGSVFVLALPSRRASDAHALRAPAADVRDPV